MRNSLSLKSRIIMQFVVVMLPITLVLAFQTISDVRRSSEMSKAFQLMDLSAGAKAHYKTFLNGVSDAVDSGNLSGSSIKALEDAREELSRIGALDSVNPANSTMQQLASMLGVLHQDSSMEAIAPLRGNIRESDAELVKLNDAYTERNRLVIRDAERSANIQKYIVLGSIVFIALITVMFIRSVGKLTNPLNMAVKMAEVIASGDLSQPIATGHNNDEIGKLLNSLGAMKNSLRDMITQIRSQAAVLSEAAAELSRSSSQIASSSEQQSKVVTSIAASVEANNAIVENVAQNALKAQEISTESEQLSSEGGEVIFKVVSDMHDISETVGNASRIIRDLEAKSQQISSIIKVIKEIADQTNLLALNAAIEAARAGEQGRGFAVVADEVRKLADRTSQSTREITEMIEKIQVGTGHAVSSMEATVKQVAEGESLTQRAGNSIGQIKFGAQQVSLSVNEISMEMQKESVAIGEITRSIEEIARMSQQNNHEIHAMTDTAKHLEQLSGALQSAVGHFRL
ncbi:MAG: methyl-accepting chemotaxis protein [Nitrosomonadales bacterium]|nr:methyl-accepting chemotaxis protein [Nitrosomonadales bacterium]